MLRNMKCLTVVVSVFLAALTASAFPHSTFSHPDTVLTARLDKRLTEYLAAIERENTEVKKEECDFLIGTCSDSLVRRHVALNLYDHFRDSKVMGDEAVAIHVYDRWFAGGGMKMRSGTEDLAAKVFAEFNRQSLIGEKAPELTMETMDGHIVSLFGENEEIKRFSVLYFYDTSCATCKMQTLLLGNLFREEDFPVDFYAVYASDDRNAWEEYAASRLTFGTERTAVTHMWDPELLSDFQRKYGVIQTPRLFLVAPDGTIKGRGLDAGTLSLMLHAIFDDVELTYGSDESMSLYDGLFPSAASACADVKAVSDHIESVTLPKGDTVMFRQMCGDLLYYLAGRRGEGFREGLDYLIDTYVLSRPDVWKSQDDSLKVVGMAGMLDGLLSLSQPGTCVPDLKVPGLMLSKGKQKEGEFRLRRMRGARNYIIFHIAGCEICLTEKAAAMQLVRSDRKSKVLLVDVDEVLASDPALAGRLFDSFDLSSLPFILQTDRKGVILRRYMSLVEN